MGGLECRDGDLKGTEIRARFPDRFEIWSIIERQYEPLPEVCGRQNERCGAEKTPIVLETATAKPLKCGGVAARSSVLATLGNEMYQNLPICLLVA